MNNNIFAILNQKTEQKNICTFLSLCDNNNCVGRHLWSMRTSKPKNICKNCHSLVCYDCIVKNRKKCVMCSDGKNYYCENCNVNAIKFMCCECGNDIYLNCHCYGDIYQNSDGFLCGDCAKKVIL